MAKNNSRNYSISRRGDGIGDLSKMTETTGQIDTTTDAFIKSICKNNISNVGIGTESEVGLEVHRYPFRVVHESLYEANCKPTVAIKMWAVVDSTGAPLVFARRPAVNNDVIKSLYLAFEGLDETLASSHCNSATAPLAPPAALSADLLALMDHCKRVHHTAAQLADMNVMGKKIVDTCTKAKTPVMFQVGDNAFLAGRRHGRDVFPATQTRVNYEAIKVGEMMACMSLNYKRFDAAYPTLSTGLRTTCAYAIAWMFFNGMNEMYESREFVTVVVSGAETRKFTIKEVVIPDGYVAPPYLAVGGVIDTTQTKGDGTIMILAPALVIMAGINHYSFNHTTGGMKVGGAMLSALMMYKLINVDPAANLDEEQTRLLYETFHPVNKRGIANLHFKDCNVFTWGRDCNSSYMRTMTLDAFLSIRTKPTPAGAHKAYLAGTVLQRILNHKLGVFLPWADQIQTCVSSITDIVRQGARSHVGSSYYTGYPSITQGSSLDVFMPELAQFIQTMAARDTLAMSPHLGADVAARSGSTWTNLLKNIKNKDLTAVSAETVSEYLKETGSFTSKFDEKDKSTWTVAAADSKRQADALFSLLHN